MRTNVYRFVRFVPYCSLFGRQRQLLDGIAVSWTSGSFTTVVQNSIGIKDALGKEDNFSQVRGIFAIRADIIATLVNRKRQFCERSCCKKYILHGKCLVFLGTTLLTIELWISGSALTAPRDFLGFSWKPLATVAKLSWLTGQRSNLSLRGNASRSESSCCQLLKESADVAEKLRSRTYQSLTSLLDFTLIKFFTHRTFRCTDRGNLKIHFSTENIFPSHSMSPVEPFVFSSASKKRRNYFVKSFLDSSHFRLQKSMKYESSRARCIFSMWTIFRKFYFHKFLAGLFSHL